MNTQPKYNIEKLLGTLRILYVEDDAEALLELGHFLRKKVAALSTASNGTEALTLCHSHHYDAIICDLWMPEMDGLAFIGELRKEGIPTPVIITSAISDSDTILKAVDLGITKYCVKPIEIDELLACLCRIATERLSEAGEIILPGNRLLERQQRLESEKTLKSGYAFLLKTLAGKGPKEVHASLSTDCVELWATEVLTPLEQSILKNPGNNGLVVYMRRVFYTSNQARFEALLSETLQVSASLKNIQINLQENTDRLLFRFR